MRARLARTRESLRARPKAAVVFPRTAEEVSTAVKFATANGIGFNVKGGGHSTSQANSAPSPEGMVLDLGLMRDVSVDADAQTVTFQGGCLWNDVDEALWKHGLATVGGTVSHTGVAGLILHGGFGFLTGQRGLAIDVLLSAQVVLADGSIVRASEKENHDLFWALRGAGSSFGVVTEFTSKAFPQGEAWSGLMILTVDKLPHVVDFINTWAETNDGTQTFVVNFTHAPPTPGSDPNAPTPPVIFVMAGSVGPEPEKKGPEFYKPLLDLESLMCQTRVVPYPEVNKVGDDGPFAWGRRYLFGGANFTTPLKLSTAEAVRDKFESLAAQHPGAGIEASTCMWECIPNKATREVPVSSTAYNNRGAYFNVGIGWTWNDESLDTEVRNFNREFQKFIRSLGYHDNELKDGIGQYLNYAGLDAMSAEAAFGANADRLRRLKKQYDPNNVFDKLWKLIGKLEESQTTGGIGG